MSVCVCEFVCVSVYLYECLFLRVSVLSCYIVGSGNQVHRPPPKCLSPLKISPAPPLPQTHVFWVVLGSKSHKADHGPYASGTFGALPGTGPQLSPKRTRYTRKQATRSENQQTLLVTEVGPRNDQCGMTSQIGKQINAEVSRTRPQSAALMGILFHFISQE